MGASGDPCLIPREASMVPTSDLKGMRYLWGANQV